MKIVSNTERNDRKRWALRFHRVTINPTAWESYLSAAANQGADAAAQYAAIKQAISTSLENVALQVLNICDSASAFIPRTTTSVAGVSVRVDYPSVGLPCMLCAEATQSEREQCTQIGKQRKTSLLVMTALDGFAYITPYTSALTQAIALKHYQRVASTRELSAGEQQAYADVQAGYTQSLNAAASFYAWYPCDFIYIKGDFLYTTPGGVLDGSLSTGLVGGGGAHVSVSSTMKAPYTNARAEGANIADLTASILSANADVDDPDAIVDYAQCRWARFDVSQHVVIALSATESRELLQTPQSLIGVAHDLVRDAFGDCNLTLKDYANTIYYMGRAVARITGKSDVEAQSVEFLVGSAYRDFVDYARAVGLLPECTASSNVMVLAETLRSRQWVITHQTVGNEAAKSAIASCFARRTVSTSIITEALAAVGVQTTPSVTVTRDVDSHLIVVEVSLGGVSHIRATLPLHPALTQVNEDMLRLAQNFNLHRSARYEFLTVAASSSGTSALVEMRGDDSSLSVTAPAIRVVQDKVAGVGLAADEFATPFRI